MWYSSGFCYYRTSMVKNHGFTGSHSIHGTAPRANPSAAPAQPCVPLLWARHACCNGLGMDGLCIKWASNGGIYWCMICIMVVSVDLCFFSFTSRSPSTSFVFPSFPVPATTCAAHYWKKLTCGVIWSFNFFFCWYSSQMYPSGICTPHFPVDPDAAASSSVRLGWDGVAGQGAVGKPEANAWEFIPCRGESKREIKPK